MEVGGDLKILRAILIYFVWGIQATSHDNPNIATVHYQLRGGGYLSALERISCLVWLSFMAQAKTPNKFVNEAGFDNNPYFRNFLSMLPNPSRVGEIPESFNLNFAIFF
jgi:hypothetical protein